MSNCFNIFSAKRFDSFTHMFYNNLISEKVNNPSRKCWNDLKMSKSFICNHLFFIGEKIEGGEEAQEEP